MRGNHKIMHLIIASTAVFITIGMILYPETAFDGAYEGLNVWWNVVFPALLPFFIGAEILMGLGVVRFMGTLLQPIMRPVFNVPGSGSFVMAVGLASGFPLGSILTAKMRREKLCTKTEAERLICFTNTADPLFMFGAVAVGIMNNPYLGTLIAISHYASSFSIGLIMRFYKKNNKDITLEDKREENIIIRAFKAMFEAKRQDGRPFGQLMGDAIKNSINTLLLIGGFIVIFSVIISILDIIGVEELIVGIISTILAPFGTGFEPEVIPAFISGFFEVSLGCEKAGTLPGVSMLTRLMAISAIIGWSGISVHAQVASITSDTDINIIPFIIARSLHGFLAAIYTIPVTIFFYHHQPVLASAATTFKISELVGIESWLYSTSWFFIILIILLIVTIISCIIGVIINGLKIKSFKVKN